MISKLITVVVAGAILAVVVQSVPDVKRYIELRSM
jgi:hypothetical protein